MRFFGIFDFWSANQLGRKRRARKYAQVCYQLVPARTPFAPASQQRIKRLKPTNTRLKHQSEQFWVAEKLQRAAPLCSFLRSQNSSNCCLSLVFVGFNLLIICWLAGANDEVHSFKFNPYFLTFEILGIFWRHISPKSCKKSIWAENSSFFKIALKRVLTLPKARSRQMRQFPLKIMGLQNKNISVVTKH